jgi:hypothetical protein
MTSALKPATRTLNLHIKVSPASFLRIRDSLNTLSARLCLLVHALDRFPPLRARTPWKISSPRRDIQPASPPSLLDFQASDATSTTSWRYNPCIFFTLIVLPIRRTATCGSAFLCVLHYQYVSQRRSPLTEYMCVVWWRDPVMSLLMISSVHKCPIHHTSICRALNQCTDALYKI